MKKERVNIGPEWVQLNEGQLPWLPKNPRKWTQTDIDKTAASIKEDPDFLEDRPLLVVSLKDTPDFVVFAGNLRSEGAKAAGRSLVPCVLYTPETADDYETIRRRAMKDNGSFGQFDWDEVFSSPWGQMDLDAMGIGKAFQQGGDPFNEGGEGEGSPDDYGTEFSLPDGEGPASNQITFYFAPEQKAFVRDMLERAEEGTDNFGNESANGNKLYQIVKQWAESRI